MVCVDTPDVVRVSQLQKQQTFPASGEFFFSISINSLQQSLHLQPYLLFSHFFLLRQDIPSLYSSGKELLSIYYTNYNLVTMSLRTTVAASLLAAAQLVAGHGAIIAATGDAGGNGMALGIDPNTPRDGTRRDPFQQDATRFKGDNADTFGETVGAGNNQLESGTKAIMAMTGDQLPQVTPGGFVDATLHQVNGDGGGPYDCMINSDGTGASWTNINVITTPPGQNSRNRVSHNLLQFNEHDLRQPLIISQAGAMTDFPLKAAIPADQTCTGTVAGQNNVCLVRCQNAARAGPFGGIIPVQLAQPGNTPAAARRNLARSIQETEAAFKRMMKRAVEAEEDEE